MKKNKLIIDDLVEEVEEIHFDPEEYRKKIRMVKIGRIILKALFALVWVGGYTYRTIAIIKFAVSGNMILLITGVIVAWVMSVIDFTCGRKVRNWFGGDEDE